MRRRTSGTKRHRPFRLAFPALRFRRRKFSGKQRKFDASGRNPEMGRLALLFLLSVALSACMTMTTDDPVSGIHCDNSVRGFLFWYHTETKFVDRQGNPIASPSSQTGLGLTH